MAVKATYIVQGFTTKRGQIVPDKQEAAPSESGAVKKAEAWSKRMPAAAALAIVMDGDEVQAITVVETFGAVPEGFAEGLLP